MTKKNIRTAKLVYGICLTVLTALVGVLFIVQAWTIFRSAEQDPYTVEIIGEKFREIAAPVFIWVAAVIGGGVIGLIFPEEKERPRAYIRTQLTLTRLQRRVAGGGRDIPEVRREELTRNVLRGVCLLLCAVATVACLAIFLDGEFVSGFGSEFFAAHDEAGRLLSMLPWALGALTAATIVSYLLENSRKKEVKTLKEAVAKKPQTEELREARKTPFARLNERLSFLRSPKLLLGIRISLYAVGVAFVIVGIANGGMADLLTKAINICTQCIGLG